MNNLLKKGFLLGLGAAVVGKERVEETVKSLVQKGQMAPNEAEAILDEFFKKGEEKSDRWNEELRNMTKQELKELGFVTQEELSVVHDQLTFLREEIEMIKNDNKNTNDSTEKYNTDYR
ncbi:phasin-related domain-containing protein [Mesobacillus harenae]|uniref:phasin-related domain-containing protein n=1 Tax=Mesobacillus harenae TaxID=2213203 RepID=UPI001580E354|nr:hypothetical protein [Mesobacillus harenae]